MTRAQLVLAATPAESGPGLRCSGPALLLLLLSFCSSACAPAPEQQAPSVISGPDSGAPAATRVTVLQDRPFGLEGEVPLQLLAGPPEQLWARSQSALYLLDLAGRVLLRAPLPLAEGLTVPVSEAASSGNVLALALRWPRAGALAAGSYLLFADAAGLGDPTAALPLGGPASTPRLTWSSRAFVAAWTEPQPAGELALLLRRAAAGQLIDPAAPPLRLATYPLTTALGELISSGPDRLSLCTVGLAGEIGLQHILGDSALPPVTVAADGPAIGRCRLASSGRSTLVTLSQAPPADAADAGLPIDGSLGTVRYPIPLAQLIDPSGAALPAPQRLSAAEGTLDLEDLLWDGARYLVLLNAAGYRGGRLLLAALDESGRLLFRDLPIPLPVEPGQLRGGRLAATPTGLYLLYGLQRPWDQGVLYLARLELRELQPLF